MASSVDDLTIAYEEDGIAIVQEIDKEILSKGVWATIIYRYRQWDRRKEEYGPDQFSIRRYQKRNNEFTQKSKFTISSKVQAQKIVSVLQEWTKDEDG